MLKQRELSLVKGEERFVFRYAPGGEEDVLDAFVVMANERDSNFDWFDAAVLSFQLSKHLVEEADELLCPPKCVKQKKGEKTKNSWHL